MFVLLLHVDYNNRTGDYDEDCVPVATAVAETYAEAKSKIESLVRYAVEYMDVGTGEEQISEEQIDGVRRRDPDSGFVWSIVKAID